MAAFLLPYEDLTLFLVFPTLASKAVTLLEILKKSLLKITIFLKMALTSQLFRFYETRILVARFVDLTLF